MIRLGAGQTLATMLPHIMNFNKDDKRIAAKYARVAQAFGVYQSGKSDLENAQALSHVVVVVALMLRGVTLLRLGSCVAHCASASCC